MRRYTRIVLIGLLILGLFCSSASAVASVTDLKKYEVGYTWINWSWSNPDDPDFNNTIVSINGEKSFILSNNTEFYYDTDLLSDTTYIIKIQTVNVSGVTNSTEVTDEAKTLDNIPPLSIANLQNETGDSWIKWTWDNPSGDFNYTMIYINGVLKENISTTEYNHTGLQNQTTHKLATHTVDTNGNINDTWKNDTATTNGVTGTTLPASITNIQNETGDSWIKWTWTNPSENFNHTMIYIDDKFEENVSTEEYNYTGLQSAAEHKLSTHTVNSNGNINDTWKNNTATTKDTASTPDNTPPDSVEELKASDIGTDWIKWTWENPSDKDFNHTIVIIDDKSPVNVSNITTSYTATNLTPNTNYTIKLQTVDINGNVNSTVVDNSVKTMPKTYYTGNRIWEEGMSPTYMWDAMSFSGFYYDLDSGLTSESMEITSIGRSIDSGNLNYTTIPINTDFEHKKWGSYQVLGFMAENYFAGYTSKNTSFADETVSVISSGQLSKVLMNEDKQHSVYAGSVLVLEDGYTLNVVEVDKNGDSVFVKLTKDGSELDSGVLSSNDDYVYTEDIGSEDDVPIIVVHFNEIFQGAETSAIFVEGIFQISDEYITVKNGDTYGKMEVTAVDANQIKMENENSISLTKGKTIDIMGKIKFLVADSNTIRFAPFVDMTDPGTYELRGTVAENEDYKWTPLNFEGFYYNMDDGEGTESLEVESRTGTTIPADGLVYEAKPASVSFEYGDWKNYSVVGFMAENYFAEYPSTTTFTDGVSLISDGQLSKVLINEDKSRAMHSGSGLILDEGYVLNIIEVDKDGGKVAVSLSKDGSEIGDMDVVTAGDTYVYKKDLGSSDDVPIIAVHFEQIFQGQETSAVFVDGIFQISDQYITVEDGDTYGKMEVTSTSGKIEMRNENSISLSRGKSIPIMGDIFFKVADDPDDVRYYPYVEISTVPLDSLNISMPASVKQGDEVSIIVTSRGAAVSDVAVKFDDDNVGKTSAEGTISFKPALSGTYTVTAEKEGYVSASDEVEVISPLDETKKMSIEVSPDIVYEGNQLTISVIKAIGGEVMEGVDVSYDGKSLGTTSSDGTISYTVKEPGMHKLIATRTGNLDAEFNLEVLALEAKFEFSNLVVSPLEVKVGKDVTITLNASNNGNAEGEYNVDLMINGNLTESRVVALEVDESTTIEFTVAKDEPGTYLVEANGLSGKFEVLEKVSTLIYVLGILGAFAAAAVVYLFTAGGWTVEMVSTKVAEFIESIR